MLEVKDFRQTQENGVLILDVDGVEHKIDFIPDVTGIRDFEMICPTLVQEKEVLISDDDVEDFVNIVGACLRKMTNTENHHPIQ